MIRNIHIIGKILTVLLLCGNCFSVYANSCIITWNTYDEVSLGAFGNSLVHEATGTGWGSAGASTLPFLTSNEDGYIEVDPDLRDVNFAIGFTLSDNNSMPSDIDYRLQFEKIGEENVEMSIYGPADVVKHTVGINHIENFKLEISRTEGKVKVYKGNTLIWSENLSAIYATSPLIIDASVHSGVTYNLAACKTSGGGGGEAQFDLTTEIAHASACQNNAQVTVKVDGIVNSLFQYKWTGPNITVSGYVQGDNQRSNLESGIYTIWVKDTEGNEKSIQAFIGNTLNWTNLMNASASDQKVKHIANTPNGLLHFSASSVDILPSAAKGYIQLKIDEISSGEYIVGFISRDVNSEKIGYSFRHRTDQHLELIWDSPRISVDLGEYAIGDVYWLELDRDLLAETIDQVRVYKNGNQIHTHSIIDDQLGLPYAAGALSIYTMIEQAGVETHPITADFCGGFWTSPLTIDPATECADNGAITLNSTNTSETLSYLWSGPNVSDPTAIPDATNKANLAVGDYTITISDQNEKSRIITTTVAHKIHWENRTNADVANHKVTHTGENAGWGTNSAVSISTLDENEAGYIEIRMDEILTTEYAFGFDIDDVEGVPEDMGYRLHHIDKRMYAYKEGSPIAHDLGSYKVGDIYRLELSRGAGGDGKVHAYRNGVELWSEVLDANYTSNAVVANVAMIEDGATTHQFFASFCGGFALATQVINPRGCLTNGSISIIVTGGVPPFEYAWDGGDEDDIFRVDDHTKTGLYGDAYTIRVRDSQGDIEEIEVELESDLLWTNLINATQTEQGKLLSTSSASSGATSWDFLEDSKSGYIELTFDEEKTDGYYIGFATKDAMGIPSNIGYSLRYASDKFQLIWGDGNVQELGYLNIGDRLKLHVSRGAQGDGYVRVYKNDVEVWGQLMSNHVDELGEDYTSKTLFASAAIISVSIETHPIKLSFCGGYTVDASVQMASSCQNNGRIDLTVDQGWPPYSFKWTGPNLAETTYTQGASSKEGLQPGLYTIWIRDGRGKVRSVDVVVGNQTAWTGFVNATVVDGNLKNTASTDGWTYSRAYSPNILPIGQSGSIELIIDESRTTDYAVGFATGVIGTNINEMYYQLTHKPDGQVYFKKGTTGTAISGGAAQVGEVFRLELSRTGDGGDNKLRVYRNGIEAPSHTQTISASYQEDALILNAGIYTAGGETHLISSSFCGGTCDPIWVYDMKVAVDAEDKIASILEGEIGGAPFGIFELGEGGKYILNIKQLNTTYRLKLVMLENGQPTDDEFALDFNNGLVQMRVPSGEFYPIGVVKLNDQVSIQRKNGRVSYYLNGTERIGFTGYDGAYEGDIAVAIGANHPESEVYCHSFDVRAANIGCLPYENHISLEVSTDGGLTYTPAPTSGYNYSWAKDGEAFTDCTTGDCANLASGIYKIEVTNANSYTRTLTYSVGGKPLWSKLDNASVEGDGGISKSNVNEITGASTATGLAVQEDGFVAVRINRADLTSQYYVGLAKADFTPTKADYDFYLYYDKGLMYYKNPTGDHLLIGQAKVGDEYSIRREGGKVSYYFNDYEYVGYDNYNSAYLADAVVNVGQTHAIRVSFEAAQPEGLYISADKSGLCGYESATLKVGNYVLREGESFKWFYEREGTTSREELTGEIGSEITVNYDNPGIYFVQLIGNNCTSALSGPFEMLFSEVPRFVLSVGNNDVCSGNDVNPVLTVTNSNKCPKPITVNYIVSTEDGDTWKTGSIPEGQNLLILQPNTLTSTATFSILSVVAANGCESTDQKSITALVKPAIEVEMNVLNEKLCDGEDVNVEMSFNGSGPYELTYRIDNVIQGESRLVKDLYDGTQFSIAGVGGGTNKIIIESVTDLSPNGCTRNDEIEIEIIVNARPDGELGISSNEICKGDPITLELNATEGQGPFQFTWTDGDGEYYVIGESVGTSDLVEVALDETSTPSAPVVSTVYQLLTVTDANGCSYHPENERQTVSVNGLPGGYLFTDKEEVCGYEVITLKFKKTFPVNNDGVTIKYTDGVDIFTASIADFQTGDDYTFSFKPYGDNPAEIPVDAPEGTKGAPFIPITTFRMVSIETKAPDNPSLTIISTGLGGKQPVTINKQPEGLIYATDEVCEEGRVDIEFLFPKGQELFNVKIQEDDLDPNTPLPNKLEFLRIKSGDTRPAWPNGVGDFKYILTEVTDANGCTIEPIPTAQSIFQDVYVNPNPIVTMQLDLPILPDKLCEGEAVPITVIASGGAGGYEMQFTDGIQMFGYSGATANAISVPTKSTTYSVMSVVDAKGCIVQEGNLPSQFVEVFLKPSLKFVADRTCSPEESIIQFTASSGIPPFSIEYQLNNGLKLVESKAYLEGVLGQPITEADVTLKVLEVKDGNTCFMDLPEPLTLSINTTEIELIAQTPTICSGETALLSLNVLEGCPPFSSIAIKVDGTDYPLDHTLGWEEGSVIALENLPIGHHTVYINKINGENYTSNSIGVRVSAPISAPTGLAATTIMDEAGVSEVIKLTWDDLDNEDGYIIKRRKLEQLGYNVLANVGINVTSFVDETALIGEAYTYAVQARDGACESSDAITEGITIYQMAFISPALGYEYCNTVGKEITFMWSGALQDNSNNLELWIREVSNPSTEVRLTIVGGQGGVDDHFNWTINKPAGEYEAILRKGAYEVISHPFKIQDNCIDPLIGSQEPYYHAELHNTLDEQYHVSFGDELRFRLEEKYAENQTSSFRIYDWKNDVVTGFEDARLMKTYGHNFYLLDLKAQGMVENDVYIMEVKDEVANESKYLRFKYQKAPALEIAINTVQLGTNMCDVSGTPNINFVPVLTQNGTERYHVEWFFSRTEGFDESTKQLLQRDASGDATLDGWLTKTQVEGLNDDPNVLTSEAEFKVLDAFYNQPYFVYLRVTDSCGKQVITGMKITCGTPQDPNSGINISILDITQGGE